MSFKAEHTDSFPGKGKEEDDIFPLSGMKPGPSAVHCVLHLDEMNFFPAAAHVITTEGILISMVRRVIAFPPQPLSLPFGF